MPNLSKFQISVDDVLLHEDGLSIEDDEVYAALRPECCSCLRRCTLPPLALANKLYRGPVPSELRDLTFIEEQIIARCRSKCCIVHLRTDSEDEDAPVLPSTQRGFKGHIIIHPQRAEQVAAILPPTVEDIVTPICVIFVGSVVPTKQWLERKAKPLVVRRERIRAALCWLKANNPLYRSIEIDERRLEDIPIEGLLPYPTEHLPSVEASEAVTARYDSDITMRDIERQQVEFQKVVITDVDGHTPSSQLCAAAIRHIKRKGGGYVEMPHDPQPVNEFCNPSLFPMIYPTLFPYGIGGFEERTRTKALSLKRQVKHL
ncbi:hypothetical protein C2E23DRAFT_724926, partial [Lenzites betulinus]